MTMAKSMSEFNDKYSGKDYFTTDEIPEDINVRRTEKQVGPDGVEIEVPRENIPAFEVYPQLYRKFSESYAKAAASSIDDPSYRDEWSAKTTMTIEQGFSQAAVTANNQRERILTQQLMGQIDNELTNQRYSVASSLAEDIKDPVMRQEVMHKIAFKVEDDSYTNLILSGVNDPSAVRDMSDAVARLQDPSIVSTLSPAQRLAKAQMLQSSIDRHIAAANAAQEERKQQIVSDAWLQIDAGDPRVDEAFVQQMFDDGVISGSTMTSMKRSIIKTRESAVEQHAIEADIDAAASGGYGIDPQDKKARKAVDSRYDKYLQEYGEGREMDAAVRIMREFKVVPSDVQSMFRANNRSDGPALAQAAQLWQYAQTYAPQSLSDFNNSEVGVIKQVAARMSMGISPTDAVEQVRRFESMTPQQKTALEREASVIRKSNETALADMANDQESWKLPWGWVPFKNGTPDIPSFMQSEFDSSVESYMGQAGFDVKVAQRMAFSDLSKKYVRTDVNGKYELMKNGPQAPTEQIRSLIASQYKGGGYLKDATERYGKRLEYSNIRIQPDQATELAISQGKKPTYRAFLVIDEDMGIVEELPRFQWDPQKAADARRNELLDQAKAEREKAIKSGKEDFERRRAEWHQILKQKGLVQ